MADVVYNNFTYGIVSPKLAGRVDSQVYRNGLSDMLNVLPMVQGGFTRRPATQKVFMAESADRWMIPFILDTARAYLLVLGGGRMRIIDPSGAVLGSFGIVWTDTELPEVQYTQDYQALYLAHRSHKPHVLRLETAGTWSFSALSVETMDDEEHQDRKVDFSGTDCPSGCQYRGSRLWFYSSIAHPFRLWASEANLPTSYKTYDNVEVVDDAATSDKYAQAIKEIGKSDATQEEISEKLDSLEPATKMQMVVSEDNAMILEAGGNRNDKVMWMGAAGGYLVVGTAASEWMLPGSVNPLEQQMSQVSAYGSAPMQCVQAGTEIIYLQAGARRLRTFGYSSVSGLYGDDLTYHCDRILKAGVRCMAWQRVPEQRLYCVLQDGSMAVLVYDKGLEIKAWTRWTIQGSVLCVSVLDSPDGQDVYILTERDGVRRVERFDEDTEADGYKWIDMYGTDKTYSYESKVVTERLEPAKTTLGRPKRIVGARIRVLESGPFIFDYYKGKNRQYSAIDEGEADLLLQGGYQKDLKLAIQAVGDEPLTVLAMALDMEAT